MYRIFLLFFVFTSVIFIPVAAIAVSPADVESMVPALASHFRLNKVSITPEATETGMHSDGTPYIKMFTTEFLPLLIMVFPSDSDASRELLKSQEKITSNQGSDMVYVARNGNVLITVIALSADQKSQVQNVLKAFKAYEVPMSLKFQVVFRLKPSEHGV